MKFNADFLLVLGVLAQQSRAEIAMPGLSLDVGLTQAEKAALLKEHNALRAKLARGGVPGQPAAADMTRLEWSDSAARHAQEWANNCGGPAHGNHEQFSEGQNYAAHPIRSQILKHAIKGWFYDEFPLYTYGIVYGNSGHYTQIVTAFTHYVGCGANMCKGYSHGRVVCNFFMGGNFNEKPPYRRGRACSKCPPGFGFCKDYLCTPQRHCHGNRRCRCTVDRSVCHRNGKFNWRNCFCECNVGWTGLNCDEKCEDVDGKQCAPRAAKGECKPLRNPYFVDMMMNCRGSCGLCKKHCRDKLRNCADLKEWGNCNDAKEYMQEFCPTQCGDC